MICYRFLAIWAISTRPWVPKRTQVPGTSHVKFVKDNLKSNQIGTFCTLKLLFNTQKNNSYECFVFLTLDEEIHEINREQHLLAVFSKFVQRLHYVHYSGRRLTSCFDYGHRANFILKPYENFTTEWPQCIHLINVTTFRNFERN